MAAYIIYDNSVITVEKLMTGKELKALRQGLKLSQSEFGAQIGVSRVMIGLLERGQRPITRRLEKSLVAARAKPLDRLPSQFDPLIKEVEVAFISSGIPYECDLDFNGRYVDIAINELKIAIFVVREHDFSRSFVPDGWSVLVLSGWESVKMFSNMLRSVGSQAFFDINMDNI